MISAMLMKQCQSIELFEDCSVTQSRFSEILNSQICKSALHMLSNHTMTSVADLYVTSSVAIHNPF